MASATAPGARGSVSITWNGDYGYLLTNLILKDFKVRYRNMSLGVFWSLLNPLVMMTVLTVVFSTAFPNLTIPYFPLYLLCGLVPYNLFNLCWLTGASSLFDNAGLIKRQPVPRELIPIAGVLSQCIHIGIQVLLLMGFVLYYGLGVHKYWLVLPFLWLCEIVFVCGLALGFAALNVYVRDTRYIIESVMTVVFWTVPVFYRVTEVPSQWRDLYLMNPITLTVVATRNVLIDHILPEGFIFIRLAVLALLSLSIGLLVFRVLKRRFYDYL